MPRPPMSRLPTALTSSMLPGLTVDLLAADVDDLLGIDIGGGDITLDRLRSSRAGIVLILLLVLLFFLVARVIGR